MNIDRLSELTASAAQMRTSVDKTLVRARPVICIKKEIQLEAARLGPEGSFARSFEAQSADNIEITKHRPAENM